MNTLKNLEPKSVFHYYNEICSIPHISFHEKELSDYCVNFAKEHGLAYTQDDMGNVIIFSEATPGYEDKETIILQGHLDTTEDRTTADYYYDDDIAIAYALAVLDSKDIPHPRLEVVLTVCEEVGLIGASALDMSVCHGRTLINIASGTEGILTVGCAGGRRALCHIPVKREPFTGIRCELTLSGLLGGHSCTNLYLEHTNANVLLGRFLLRLKKSFSFGLLSMSGGVMENLIPKDGKAIILVGSEDLPALKQNIESFLRDMSVEYEICDPNISLTLTEGASVIENVLVSDSFANVLTALNLMPNGIQHPGIHFDSPELTETSLNMGVMELTETELLLRFSILSSIESEKEALAEKILHLTEFLGGYVEFHGDYPAWSFTRESSIRNKCIEVFQKQYCVKPDFQINNAGLECAIFSDKLPGLDCISFGPDMSNMYTPNEQLSIDSIARVWEFLKALLAA